jgi:hypothetical protein
MKIDIWRGSVDDAIAMKFYSPRFFASAEDGTLCSLPDQTNKALQYYRRARGH